MIETPVDTRVMVILYWRSMQDV